MLYAFLLCVISFGCSGQASDSKTYFDKFESFFGAFNIDSTYLKSGYIDKVELTSNEITTYIEENKELRGSVYLFDIYKYHPIAKKSSGKHTLVIVKKAGGAGGIEEHYILIVYDENGRKVDEFELAFQVGDCTDLVQQTGQMSALNEIVINYRKYNGDCDSEERNLLESYSKNYSLNPKTGKIVEVE